MTLMVTFALKLSDEHYVTELDLSEQWDAVLPPLLKRRDHDGFLRIQASGQPAQQIEDELRALVPNLCFDAVARLVAQQEALISYYSYYGSFTLVPHSEHIHLQGEYVSTATYPASSLLPALYACGWRFIQFLQQSRGEAWAYPIDELIKQAQPARVALEQAGLGPLPGADKPF